MVTNICVCVVAGVFFLIVEMAKLIWREII